MSKLASFSKFALTREECRRVVGGITGFYRCAGDTEFRNMTVMDGDSSDWMRAVTSACGGTSYGQNVAEYRMNSKC
jgi:hypothetical protein